MSGLIKSASPCLCCLLCLVTVFGKDWRGIVPLHSTRGDVKRLLGKPLFEENSPTDIYDVEEGRINFMYVLKQCQPGLPSNWGNWNVPPDTVVNITIYLKKPITLAELKVPDIEKYKWYTDDSGATYYHDKKQGIEYQVQGNLVTGITYGPTDKDDSLLCNKNAPLIRYQCADHRATQQLIAPERVTAGFSTNFIRRRLNAVRPRPVNSIVGPLSINMRWLLHWGDEIYWMPLISLLVAGIAVFGMRMLTIWLYVRRVVLPMSEIESNDEAVKVIKERYSAPGAIVPASVSSLYFLTGVALIIVTLWGTITVAWWVLPLGCIAWFVIHAPFRDVMESWSSFQRTMWMSDDAEALIKGGLTSEQERKLRKRIRLP